MLRMASYHLVFMLLCAIFIQNFANAYEFDEWDPYTFEELVKRNLIDLNANINEPRVSEDPKLRYDYDFSRPDDEKIEINDRDEPEWNAEMSETRTAFKQLRLKQREAYRKMKTLESEDKEGHKDEIEKLKTLIAHHDDSIKQCFANIIELLDGPFPHEGIPVKSYYPEYDMIDDQVENNASFSE